MQKYASKRVKGGLVARPSALTTQIEADLVPGLRHILHGHFAHWRRCKSLKMIAFPADLRLSSEQIGTCHLGLRL
ncbi:MAG TPA: hypothetical protein ENJ42_03840 [Hellea balneolensis]|uniref:Uncharacterized protein n=1 Tax=Hellea balneolensis TaxID=287478 RepID=A0A7C5R7U4_9PROT|nr:hypothetical protein [Hellea balneolensis]